MTNEDSVTIELTPDDPVVKAMQEINRAFFSTAQRLGVPVALEGLANLVINLAAAYGETVAMATLGDIAVHATPIARMWGIVAAAADHEPGHA
jgi:uncharacterized membrane protein